jgi:hypothetical protein
MENIALSLIMGIGSSLLATAIFILASECVRKIVLPWYTDKIYRGVRIDGEWEIKERHGKEWQSQNLSMNLKLIQKGEVVTGIYTHKNDQEIDEYILEGIIRDMYFLATAVPKSNRHVDAITLLLHVNNVNSKLVMTGGMLCQGKPGEVSSHLGMQFQWKSN